jgi:hypothetical protein
MRWRIGATLFKVVFEAPGHVSAWSDVGSVQVSLEGFDTGGVSGWEDLRTRDDEKGLVLGWRGFMLMCVLAAGWGFYFMGEVWYTYFTL